MVELLVSAVILSLGFVAMGHLYLASMMTYEKSRDTSVATQRAQHELEKAANLKYEGLTVSDLTAVYPTPLYTVNPDRTISFTVPDLSGAQGTIRLVKDPFAAGGSAAQNLLGFVVEIHWRGQGYPKGTVRLNTLLSRAR